MAKKKVYDSETGDVMEVGGNNLPAVEPIYALIDGFCETYKPCGSERYADETFTIARIREYFHCYTIPDPKWVDLLPKYLEALAAKDFKLRTSFCGEAAIFVQWQECPLEYDEEEDDE